MEQNRSLAIFQDRKIRRTWHDDEWWFVIEDVVVALTDSKDPKQYIQKMKQRARRMRKDFRRILMPQLKGELLPGEKRCGK